MPWCVMPCKQPCGYKSESSRGRHDPGRLELRLSLQGRMQGIMHWGIGMLRWVPVDR